MRKTPVLYKIHIGRLIKKNWNVQGKIKIRYGYAEAALKRNKIKVYNVSDLDPPKVEGPKIINSLIPEDLPLDENHPDWKSEPCYIYKNNDVLLEGLEQARVLTNTEEIYELPFSVRSLETELKLPDYIHEEAQRKIQQSCMFDAHQEKLPKRHDPERPAMVFPRDYGITDSRKNKLLINNLTQLCEQYFNNLKRNVLCDAFFSFPMRAHNKLIQFEQSADLVVRSTEALSLALNEENNYERNPIIDLHPLDCTISLKPYHFYKVQHLCPIFGTKWPYVHTLFFSHNKTEVSNIYQEPVLKTQMIGRNLLKGFTAACAQACFLYGSNTKVLIKPVIIQIIMTDGKMFHFSVLQLNTLDVENVEGVKNIYWNSPVLQLYEKCEYLKGMPVLTGYNPEVVNRIFAFYKN